MSRDDSYGQILKSSAVMGGAQGINYVIGLLRVKAVALLLGPAGIGIVGLYNAAMNMLGTVTGLGLQRSAVRAIAVAQGQDDPVAVARTIRMLRRLCWITGLLGWIASAALAIPLSRMMFQSNAHAWAIAVLGFTLLLGAVNGGQLALLRGLRRIGDIARVQVTAALLNTIATLALYAWLRERGILPVLVVSAALSLAASWWVVRKVEVVEVPMSWPQAIGEARPMVVLGIALMASTMMSSLLELYTRSVLSARLGLDAVGLYQAAWSLSGMFAGFVLSAMGTDFYPRLAAVIHDRAAATREINQQTEIGLLLALPGLLATMTLAKWVVWALYSVKFLPAADVLVWLTLGVFGRVIAWPLGYVQVALSAGRWYVVTEFAFIALQAALVLAWVPRYGVMGAAYAFFACYAAYFVGMQWVAHRLIDFRYTPACWHIILTASALVASAMLANRILPELPGLIAGLAIAFGGGFWSLKALSHRLGPGHRLIRMAGRVPGLARFLGGLGEIRPKR